MNLQRELRSHLVRRFPQEVCKENSCSCGAPNHARMFLFRVNGQPATAIVPEGCELQTGQLSRALGGARVEPLSEKELDAIFSETEMGHAEPFENPFGATVYLDENLTQFETLVFCPKMFGGKPEECFHLPRRHFEEAVRPVVLRMLPLFEPLFETAT